MSEKIYWYKFYCDFGCGEFKKFIEKNKEFNNESFFNFVISRNRGDRDSGETQDIAKHEILRLAYEWEEKRWRFKG
jgi:hypothetical protein